MTTDIHPYLSIYLIGCALVVFLTIFRVVFFWFIRWITKENILNKNLKKLQYLDESTFTSKAFLFLGAIVLEAALSWVNVLVIIFQIIKMLLNVIREALTAKPEAVKALRFPLRNNPNLSREAVWAYLSALQIKVGEKQPNESDLLFFLDEVADYYPSFNKQSALNQLMDLNILSNDIVTSAIDALAEET
ncbi:hypothetical protein MNBD_GAMMA08-1219 [hydrothermal vent metagenome]|uniref:Uncharacterized protein n=1 Tax=hydrothermal vent metagenome TaxID=652676 RepID=A0A3B0XMF7_9ZZZZ